MHLAFVIGLEDWTHPRGNLLSEEVCYPVLGLVEWLLGTRARRSGRTVVISANQLILRVCDGVQARSSGPISPLSPIDRLGHPPKRPIKAIAFQVISNAFQAVR